MSLAAAAAAAQTSSEDPTAPPSAPIPYESLSDSGAHLGVSPLADALQAARTGDINRARRLQGGLVDPVARKLVTWALVDAAGSMMPFADLDAATRDLKDWPRASRRRAVTERVMEQTPLAPEAVVAWFGRNDPETAQGAIALAAAAVQQARPDAARSLVRRFWRERTFDVEIQARMLARFGSLLTPEDHLRRLDNLLYGPQLAAARALTPLVDPDHQALAAARLALRADRDDAPALVALVPGSLEHDAGLAFDRARYYRKRNLDALAIGVLRGLPTAPPSAEAGEAIWTERRALMTAALQNGDVRGAYAVAEAHGLVDGTNYTEAEFFAGWIALTRLNDFGAADRHFAAVERAGATPTTLSRALYWRGRTAAARGSAAAAQSYWRDAGAYYTTFYGQLAAQHAGVDQIRLGRDPSPSEQDRAQFEARETVQATRLLGQAGVRDAFRSFVMSLADSLASVEEAALLVDLARQYGDTEIALRAAREASTRGFYLPERGYPLLDAPTGAGLAEPAFTLAIVRQESGFEPGIRSAAGARGLMQLMPATAVIVARKQGMAFDAAWLDRPDYNLKLGAAYLDQITREFAGSYVLAAAGYNAGPHRAAQWATSCGDPRQASLDSADFIECIPFSETRNYVMRVMENLEVYRARLAGGAAPLTLMADLHRGAWTAAAITPTSGVSR